MNQQQLKALREHARQQLETSGAAAAQHAMSELLAALAKEVARTMAAYIDSDHFDSESQRGKVIDLWRDARADWLASDRQGPSPGRMVLETLVDEHLHDDGREREELLDHEVLGTSVRNLLRSTAIKVWGHAHDLDDMTDTLADRVNDELYEEWIREFQSALHGKQAEFVYVPNWDGDSIDTMIEELGLRSRQWNSSLYLDEILPTESLAKFLRWVNIGTDDLISAARESRPDEAEKLVINLGAFRVDRDTQRQSLVSPEDAIGMLENATSASVPMYHCEVNLGALLDMDPSLPMAMTTAKGQIHIGLHDVVNGSGYMDMYQGTVNIPADHLGFGWVGRWKYGIDEVYGLVKSAFYVKPEAVNERAEVAA